jgi:hypothetical protein
MANMNISKPRFYTDLISYNIARGVSQNGNYDIQATNSGNDLTGIASNGGVEMDLFDLRPLNQLTFNTNRNATTQADHVVITLDMLGSHTINYIAILNHNISSATAKIRVSASDTKAHVEAVDFGSATAVSSVSEIVNADNISSNVITPAADGSTIFTFTGSHLRYWGIQFEGYAGNFSSTALKIGSVMAGRYYDMVHTPDLNIKRSIQYDKTKIQESLGGQRYTSTSSLGRVAGSPFSLGSNQYAMHGGRLGYDMKFSYLQNDDIMPDEYGSVEYTDTSFVGNVWNITDGNNRPFIFSIDNSSTGTDAESEHIFSRFGQDTLEMTQSAHNVFNIGLAVTEEF